MLIQSALPQANQTVPTGLLSLPPPGPAIPDANEAHASGMDATEVLVPTVWRGGRGAVVCGADGERPIEDAGEVLVAAAQLHPGTVDRHGVSFPRWNRVGMKDGIIVHMPNHGQMGRITGTR